MELDVREDAVVALDRQRVAADEEMLVAGEAEHEVAGAEADMAVVRGDADDGGIPERARARVPAGVEWWVEVEAVLGDLDGGDGRHWPHSQLDPREKPI